MDEEHVSPVVAMDEKRRRSSILKPVKPRNPLTEIDQLDETEKQTRKVRFSSNFVKPFTTEEYTTIWDRTYEEPIEASDDTPCSSIKMLETTVPDTTKQNRKSNQTWKKDRLLFGEIQNDYFDNQGGLLNISDYNPGLSAEENESVKITMHQQKNTTFVQDELNLTLKGESLAMKASYVNVDTKVESVKSVCLSKTIFDQTEMEMTEAVPVSSIKENLEVHQQQYLSQWNEAATDVSFCIPAVCDDFASHGGRKTMLAPICMEMTVGAPCEGVDHQQFPGMSSDFLPSREFKQQQQHQSSSNERRTTIYIPTDINLTEAASSKILEKGTNKTSRLCGENDMPNSHCNQFSSDKKENNGRSMNKAIPLVSSSDLLINSIEPQQQNFTHDIGKTIFISTDMELTEVVPANILVNNREENLAGFYDKNSDKPQSSSGNRKSILRFADIEFTKTVPDCSPFDRLTERDDPVNEYQRQNSSHSRRKTILISEDMELTEAVPASILENKWKDDSLEFVSYHHSSEDLQSSNPPTNMNGKSNTILIPQDMEFSEAVPADILVKGKEQSPERSSHDNINIIQPYSGRRKTILSTVDMEFTEGVPDFPSIGVAFSQQKDEKRKTTFIHGDMELTEPVLRMVEDPTNNIIEHPEMKLNSDVMGYIDRETIYEKRKPVLIKCDMEMTGVFPVDDLENTLAPERMDILENIKKRSSEVLISDDSSRNINSKSKTLCEEITSFKTDQKCSMLEDDKKYLENKSMQQHETKIMDQKQVETFTKQLQLSNQSLEKLKTEISETSKEFFPSEDVIVSTKITQKESKSFKPVNIDNQCQKLPAVSQSEFFDGLKQIIPTENTVELCTTSINTGKQTEFRTNHDQIEEIRPVVLNNQKITILSHILISKPRQQHLLQNNYLRMEQEEISLKQNINQYLVKRQAITARNQASDIRMENMELLSEQATTAMSNLELEEHGRKQSNNELAIKTVMSEKKQLQGVMIMKNLQSETRESFELSSEMEKHEQQDEISAQMFRPNAESDFEISNRGSERKNTPFLELNTLSATEESKNVDSNNGIDEGDRILEESETTRIIRESMVGLPEIRDLHHSLQSSQCFLKQKSQSTKSSLTHQGICNKILEEPSKVHRESKDNFQNVHISVQKNPMHSRQTLQNNVSNKENKENQMLTRYLPEVKNLQYAIQTNGSLLNHQSTSSANESCFPALQIKNKNPNESLIKESKAEHSNFQSKLARDESHLRHRRNQTSKDSCNKNEEEYQMLAESETSRIIRESMMDLPEARNLHQSIRDNESRTTSTTNDPFKKPHILEESLSDHRGISTFKRREFVTPNVSLSLIQPEASLYSPCVDDTQALIHYDLSGKKTTKFNFSAILTGDDHDVPLPRVQNFPLGLQTNSFKIFSDESAIEDLPIKDVRDVDLKTGKKNLFGNCEMEVNKSIHTCDKVNKAVPKKDVENGNYGKPNKNSSNCQRGENQKVCGKESNEVNYRKQNEYSERKHKNLLKDENLLNASISEPERNQLIPKNDEDDCMERREEVIENSNYNREENQNIRKKDEEIRFGQKEEEEGNENNFEICQEDNVYKCKSKRNQVILKENDLKSPESKRLKVCDEPLLQEKSVRNNNCGLIKGNKPSPIKDISVNMNPQCMALEVMAKNPTRIAPINTGNLQKHQSSNITHLGTKYVTKIVIIKSEPQANTSLQNTSQTLNNLIGISNESTHHPLLDDTSFHLLSDVSNEMNTPNIVEPDTIPLNYAQMDTNELLQQIPPGWDADLLRQLTDDSYCEAYDQILKDNEEFQINCNEFRVLQKNVIRQAEEIMKWNLVYDKPKTLKEIIGLVSDHGHEITSIREKVEDQAKLCEIAYKIILIEDDVYTVTTLYNTIFLIVTIDNQDKGLVKNMNVYSRISDESEVIAKYINGLFMEKLKDTHIKSSVGEKYTILTLLDYIHMNFQSLDDFDTDLVMLQMQYGIIMHPDFKIVYLGASHKLKVVAEVIVICMDYNKIDDSCISVNLKNGHIDERSIKTIANNCTKGLSFLRSFIEKIDDYFSDR